MIQFRGMTWNHERGVNPLLAAARDFAAAHPDVTIEWDARSLADFERYPLEKLADRYDLIMIDHPHIGTAVRGKLLLPLGSLLPESFLQDQEAGSVGQSYSSYTWEGEQWALAVDAAAQTAAYRQDLLEAAQADVPATWDAVIALAGKLPKGQIGLPLVPVHAFSSYFTLTSQISGKAYWSDGEDIPAAAGEAALRLLRRLVPLLHPQSFHSDPIAMSELMSQADELAYVPLMYGYSNYAQNGFRPHVIRYADIPSNSGAPGGSMIGGVGLAISARCRHPELAAEFVRMTADANYQRTAFFAAGGQPGHRSAWTDPDVNERSNGFYADTLRTLDLGSMRPRFHGYIEFQERAGERIREFLMSGGDAAESLVRELNELIRSIREASE